MVGIDLGLKIKIVKVKAVNLCLPGPKPISFLAKHRLSKSERLFVIHVHTWSGHNSGSHEEDIAQGKQWENGWEHVQSVLEKEIGMADKYMKFYSTLQEIRKS